MCIKYSTIKKFRYVATCNTTMYSLITFRAFSFRTHGEYPKILSMQNIPDIRYTHVCILYMYYFRDNMCILIAGITFDTGGISIKPSASMGDMKADMGGAACVAGATYAIAKMGLPLK